MFRASNSSGQSMAVQVLITAALLALVFLMIYAFFPIVNDYYYYYHPVAQQWLAGSPTLAGNAGNVLVYPPWTVLFLVLPLGMPSSLALGSAVLTLLTLILLLASCYLVLRFRPAPRLVVLLSVFNLFTVELVLMGQLDAFTLFGVMLCWWALREQRPWGLALGLCLLAMKPYNVVLFGLVLLLEMRRWSVGALARAFSLPLLMVLLSLVLMLLAGFDWLNVFVDTSRRQIVTDISIVLWRGLAQLGLPALPFVLLALGAALAALRVAWRDGLTERTCALVLGTTLVFTPYAHADYYVLLIPAFIYVGRQSLLLALLAFALSFTPLLRLAAGPEISWVSVVYPALLLVSAWLLPDAASAVGTHAPTSAQAAVSAQQGS